MVCNANFRFPDLIVTKREREREEEARGRRREGPGVVYINRLLT